MILAKTAVHADQPTDCRMLAPACSVPPEDSTLAHDTPAIDYEDAPLRPFHARLFVACSAGVFSDGYGLGIIGIALSAATPRLDLNAVWLGLLGGASLFGLFAGAMLAGPIADRFGRRPLFACNMLLLGVLSAAQALCATGGALLVLRLLVGLLLGTDYVVSKALLSEMSPRRMRGRLLGSLSIAWAGGYACAYLAGVLLSTQGPQAWRLMLLTSAVPCLLVMPLRFRVPESPLWLVGHGRAETAMAVVRTYLGPGIRPPAAPARPPASGTWPLLFSARWRQRTAVGAIFFTCQVIPYFAVGTFISQVLAELHVESSYAGGLVYNAALLVGAVGGMLVVDRLPRRTFLLASFTSTAAALAILLLWPGIPPFGLALLFAVFAGVLSAATNLVYVYLPELFATELRASGIGLSIAASRIGSAIATFLFPLVVSTAGVRTALGACAGVLVMGAVVCARYAPETRHLPLGALDVAAPP